MTPQDQNKEPSAITEQIEQLCDRFEAAWKSGSPPDLATYLLNIEEASRPTAFRALLRTEFEMRRTQGDLPSLAEYQRRFPERAAQVAEFFHSADQRGPETLFTPRTYLKAGLHVRCPHCHSPIELVPDAELESIHCQSCGSDFSLTSEVSEGTHVARGIVKLGHFKLVERVGMGAFGSVWKALDTDLDRTVAVKIPRAGQLNKQQQDFFFREARSAAQLRHPNIVPVYEVGREGETLYIVSEFVRGVTLGDWLTGQQLTNREAAELCSKIADALHHAHEHGVIHRDLKPGNIMMDGDGVPHLMDFGLARREAGEITMTLDGQILGTPAYMSPEQAQGEAHIADCRSDVYSIGVVLFQLLTGELPFRGNTRMLIHQVIHDEPPSPRKLDSNVSRDLETITLKCLEKSPELRYQTAIGLSDELQRFLTGKPILARPINLLERSWRWAKNNREQAVLRSLAYLTPILLLIIGMAWISHSQQSKAFKNLMAVTVSVKKAEASAKVAATEAVEAKFAEARAREQLAEAKHRVDLLAHVNKAKSDNFSSELLHMRTLAVRRLQQLSASEKHLQPPVSTLKTLVGTDQTVQFRIQSVHDRQGFYVSSGADYQHRDSFTAVFEPDQAVKLSASFGRSDATVQLLGRIVRVTGKTEEHDGQIQIRITDLSRQLKLIDEEPAQTP